MLLLPHLHKGRTKVYKVLSAVFTVKQQIVVYNSSQPVPSVHTYSEAVKCYADSEDIMGS